MNKQWIMHGWLEEDKEAPYFLSNCRGVSEAPSSTQDDGGRSTTQGTDQDLQHLDQRRPSSEVPGETDPRHRNGKTEAGTGALKNADAVNSDCI